jgi:ubiquinone/menaquinone biosynthesis C-methylase UbiE
MTELAQKLLRRYYSTHEHPYRVFERRVNEYATPSTVLLDAGAGRTAPILTKYLGRVARLIAVDVVDFRDVDSRIECHKSDISRIPLPDASVDLIMARSVFEHLSDPGTVYAEFRRVLRPGGRVVVLTANLWDYGSIAARLVPNRMHARVVRFAEGRAEEDTFPTAYMTNTAGAIRRFASQNDFDVESLEYLNQYPNYLMFNGAAFLLGVAYERVTTRLRWLRFLRGWVLFSLRAREVGLP